MYAPIIIPTLNRYGHLVRCIESLQRNLLADETDIYISLDYPPAKKYEEGYLKIRKYLESGKVKGFKSVNIYFQNKNLGAGVNADFLRKEVYKKYDRFIFTEDDNEFSPNFLKYINDGLDIFEEDTDVLAICGYRNEKEWECEDANVMKVCVFHAWGYGTWRKKIDKCYNWISRDNFITLLENKKFCDYLYGVKYKSYYSLIQSLLANPKDTNNVYINLKGDISKIDYTIGIYMIAFGMCCILPKESKVRNWGYDGSGVNCARIDSIDPNETKIDMRYDFEYFIPCDLKENAHNKEINRELEYYELAKKARIMRRIMVILGIPVARKVNNLLYKINVLIRNVLRLKECVCKKV